MTWAKQIGPALLFRSNDADFEIGKFHLKKERNRCQRMPCALKQAHNTGEIDVTFEAFMSSEHMCLLVCLFFVQEEINLYGNGEMNKDSIFWMANQDPGDAFYVQHLFTEGMFI